MVGVLFVFLGAELIFGFFDIDLLVEYLFYFSGEFCVDVVGVGDLYGAGAIVECFYDILYGVECCFEICIVGMEYCRVLDQEGRLVEISRL